MKYVFLKQEKITFGGNNIVSFDIGDEIEDSKIKLVSNTLLDFYLNNGYLKKKEEKPIVEEKSFKPEIENKAIESYENKSFKDLSVIELREYLKKKEIKFHPFLGKEKLLKLIEENNNG